jgi:hypothetical protein
LVLLVSFDLVELLLFFFLDGMVTEGSNCWCKI